MLPFIVLTAVVHGVLCGNLIDVLNANSESSLVFYAKEVGLADALSSGNYTIFAPTHAALAKLSTQITLDAVHGDKTALADVLKNHIVPNKVIHKAEARNEQKLTTLAGNKIRINIYKHNNVVTVNGSPIKTFDLTATNGVVHIIDEILTPATKDIVDVVSGMSNFSTLLKKVQAAGLTSALQGRHRTLFAPTNAAFEALGANVLANLENNPQLLKDILLYHVVPHTEYSAGLYNREFLRTLDAHHDIIRFAVKGDKVTVNLNGHVTQADLRASNGVVHAIDHVLIPARHLISSIVG